MSKIDLKKDLRALYNPPSKEPHLVDVPALAFLSIDGTGDPNTATEYARAIEALYGLSYALKFMVKKETGVDYAVMPLEGLWWADDMGDFLAGRKDRWKWTAMILQPDFIGADLVERARDQVTQKKDLAALPKIRLTTFAEGLSAQIMYTGPYADEGPTITRLHGFAASQGRQLRGKHHEIYLGDPRRSAPNKLKTLIRQPIE